MMRILTCTLLVAMLAPLSAQAQSRLGLWTRAGTAVIQDDAFDAFADVDLFPRFEFGVSWGIAEELDLELGVGHGSASDTIFGSIDTRLSVTSLQAGARYRTPLLGRLSAYGRAHVAIDFGRASVETPGYDIADRATGFSAGAGAGLQLGLPLSDVGADLALFADAGYQLHTSLSFSDFGPSAGGDSEPPRITQVTTDAGSVSLSGFVWRGGIALLF